MKPQNLFSLTAGKVNLFLILAILAIVALASVFLFTDWLGQKEVANMSGQQALVVFTSPENSESISVVFNNEDQTAVLSGAGYESLVFTSAIAASGARYINEDEGLELWNRGNEIRLARGDETLFLGNVGGLTEADRLESGIWVWQATTIGAEVTEPREEKSSAFTLRFNAQENRVSGTTDCNGFSGSYTVGDDNSLTFSPLAMTKMFCQDSQETEFVTPLSNVKSFMFAGSGALVLQLSDGGTMLFGQQ